MCTLRLKVKDLKPLIIMSMADCTCVMQPPLHRCRMNVVFALGNMCALVCELEQACRQTGWLPTARRCSLVVLNSLLYAWIAAPSHRERWHASRRDWALSFTLSSSHSCTHLCHLISSKFPLQEYYWSCSAFWQPASYYFLISLVSKDTLTQRRISENWKEKKYIMGKHEERRQYWKTSAEEMLRLATGQCWWNVQNFVICANSRGF